jgi:hypothetical protein
MEIVLKYAQSANNFFIPRVIELTSSDSAFSVCRIRYIKRESGSYRNCANLTQKKKPTSHLGARCGAVICIKHLSIQKKRRGPIDFVEDSKSYGGKRGQLSSCTHGLTLAYLQTN